MNVIEHILNFCGQNEIPINDFEEKEDKILFFSDKFIMIYHKENNLLALSFHVITLPSDAAVICMKMKEIPEINITIVDVYVLSDEGVLTGSEAIEYIDMVRKDEVVKQFIQEQQKLQVLCFASGFDC